MRWLDNTWKAFIGTAPPVPDTKTTADGTHTLTFVPVPRYQSAAALPRNLKRLMDATGWKVPKLAQEAGVSQSTIRGILNGTPPTSVADPLLSTCLLLAAALGVGIEALVEE